MRISHTWMGNIRCMGVFMTANYTHISFGRTTCLESLEQLVPTPRTRGHHRPDVLCALGWAHGHPKQGRSNGCQMRYLVRRGSHLSGSPNGKQNFTLHAHTNFVGLPGKNNLGSQISLGWQPKWLLQS